MVVVGGGERAVVVSFSGWDMGLVGARTHKQTNTTKQKQTTNKTNNEQKQTIKTCERVLQRRDELVKVEVLERRQHVAGADRRALGVLADVVGRRRQEADEDLGALAKRQQGVLVQRDVLFAAVAAAVVELRELGLDDALDERLGQLGVELDRRHCLVVFCAACARWRVARRRRRRRRCFVQARALRGE